MAAVSSVAAAPVTENFRYSDFFGSPSSTTTMEPTTLVPWTCEMSKHSIRISATGSSRASCSSCSAWDRMVRSPARRDLCSLRACSALSRTVDSRAALSPRCGTRTSTLAPRSPLSHCASSAALLGSAGTRTSRGSLPWRPASSPYTCWSRCSTRSGVVESSTFSTTQPRWPRIRPPRTWKTCTAASSSSSCRAKTSASVPSARTTALRSNTFLSATMSSRIRAARS